MSIEKIRKIFKTHNALLAKYKVKSLYLFGSYLSEQYHENSDIDLIAVFQEDADLFDQLGLQYELEALFGKKIDVVTPNSLSKYFRDQVMKEAVKL